ncbi:MAG: SDR family NAD(P)-dependent oxidoreductase [Halioglobus sp.]
MKLDLTGRTALVTGSNRNTGEVIATSLARSGATVVFHSNERDGSAAAAATTVPEAFSIEGDVATPDGCASLMEQLKDLDLAVDILVNNYGTASAGKWSSTTSDDWIDMYQKNVLSVARLVQALVPEMKKQQWGRVVNLGTIGSHRPGKIMPHYYASKGALANLGVSLMQELSNTGITVNTVSPGLIHTPDLEAGFRARAATKGWGDAWEDIIKHVVSEEFPNACGRLATREEVADLVVFLCSEQAGYINGQNIRVDGGAVVYV